MRGFRWLLVSWVWISCGSAPSDTCVTGDEGCGCWANATCNPGLSCRSKLCVKLASSDEAARAGSSSSRDDDRSQPSAGESMLPSAGSQSEAPRAGAVGGAAGSSAPRAGSSPPRAGAASPSPAPVVTPEEEALAVLAQWYDRPKPQECIRDEDCGTGCCQ